jgi:hypothetical protein
MNLTELYCVDLIEFSVELILGFQASLWFLVAVPNSDIISHVSRRQKLDVLKNKDYLLLEKLKSDLGYDVF